MRRHSIHIGSRHFGHLSDGRRVRLYTLANRNGMEVQVTNYGGIITALRVPDRHGEVKSVVLGFDRLNDYLGEHPCFGAIIGRYANRIAGGRFSLGGKEWRLTCNEGEHHLHGGESGFHRALWGATPALPGSLLLTYSSRNGEEGYPGTLYASVTYRLTERNELYIDYEAVCDRPTPVNLTNHSYFNLSGDRSRTVGDHLLQLHADYVTPVDASLIPTGEIRPVVGTAWDYRRERLVEEGIRAFSLDGQEARSSGGVGGSDDSGRSGGVGDSGPAGGGDSGPAGGGDSIGGLDHNYVLRHAAASVLGGSMHPDSGNGDDPGGSDDGIEGGGVGISSGAARRVDGPQTEERLSEESGRPVRLRSGIRLFPAASLRHPESGRYLEVMTSEPGIQVYSGNHLDGRLKGPGGVSYGRHSGICLETQHFPNSPNTPAFPSTILLPGQIYRSRTLYRFGVEGD